MACSSHYSPWCPLPPIGCNNTAWQGCQCHVIFMLLLNHADGEGPPRAGAVSLCLFFFLRSFFYVSSRWQRSFTLDLMEMICPEPAGVQIRIIVVFIVSKEGKSQRKIPIKSIHNNISHNKHLIVFTWNGNSVWLSGRLEPPKCLNRWCLMTFFLIYHRN